MTNIPTAKQQTVKAPAKRSGSTIKDTIMLMEPEIKKALPNTITPERFTRIALSAVSSNPKLQQCSQVSFLAALMNSAQLGMEPNTPLGEAYLIPYGNTCQFILGYKGLIKLAHNAGVTVDAHEVYQNDEFSYQYGKDPDLKHVPALTNRGDVIGYYAIWKKDDQYGFIFSSKDDIEKHARKYSKSYSSGPWQTNFDEMAKKTVLKQALKYAPLSADVQSKISTDGTVKETISEHMDEEPAVNMAEIINGETGEVEAPANEANVSD